MHVVEQAVAAGDRVIALVRGTNVNAGLTRDGVDLIHGDATSAPDVAEAMAGADVVISTLGGRGPSTMSDAVRAVIDGAHQAGMRRVVLMSSFAVERDRLGPMTKLMSNVMTACVPAGNRAGRSPVPSARVRWFTGRAQSAGSERLHGSVEDATRIGAGLCRLHGEHARGLHQRLLAVWIRLDRPVGDERAVASA